MLYIVATPIGNLEDITLRALKVLREVDLILCEDTRVTKRLLSHYKIKTPTLSYHEHSSPRREGYILDLLKQEKKLALVTDSGTPGISDPGAKLIRKVAQSSLGVSLTSLPGPSALACAASLSAFPVNRFLFLGFLPRKKGRKKLLESLREEKRTVIFYESPFRIKKTLGDLREFLGERQVEVYRELTKKFESVYRGRVEEILDKLPSRRVRGEIVVILEGKTKR